MKIYITIMVKYMYINREHQSMSSTSKVNKSILSLMGILLLQAHVLKNKQGTLKRRRINHINS